MSEPVQPEYAGLDAREIALMTLVEIRASHSEMRSYKAEVSGLMQKVVLSLLALVGANIGLKFIGTPLVTDIAAFGAWFAGLFLLGSLVWTWKGTTWRRRSIRLSFATLLLFSVFVRTFVFEPGVEPAPWWFGPAIDGLFIVVSATLIVSAWVGWDTTAERHG